MMKQRIQILSAALLALILSVCLPVPAAAAESGEAVDAAARAAIESLMSASQAGQAGWAVWRDGTIIASGSRRSERDGNDLEGAGDAYAAGSISKVFTTVAVMQLAEAGKLELDQPVVKYLPSFKMADPRYKDITVRMLLNHSSGLMGSSFSSALLFGDPAPAATEDLLERLSAQRLKADPGAYSVYCNDGFTLAELVVEAAAGMSFEDYLRANIFAPAGLEETWFPSDGFEDRRVAIYRAADQRPLPKDCMNVIGAGGLYATPEDIAAFGGALTDQTLLKKSSLDAMAAPEYGRGLWPEGGQPSALAFGLGWDNVERYPFEQNGITALVKGGDTHFYHAGLVVLPEHRLAAAVLSAGGSSSYNEMAASKMLIAALREENVDVAELRLKLPAAQRADMPKELLDSAGYYGSETLLAVKITEDGTLSIRDPSLPDLPERKYFYYSDGTFRDGEEASALRVVKEKNGQTYLYQQSFSSLSGLGGLPASNYIAMKLPGNQVAPELQAQWEALANRAVLPMNERYSSQAYAALDTLLETAAEGPENAPGYIGMLRVEDEAHLRWVVQIPGGAGRDGFDKEARRDAKGNLWFYQSDGSVYMDAGAAPVISTGRNGGVSCTIQPDGWARWYKVGADAAGKVMTVRMPENAGFWAYDSAGNVTASSVLWGDSSAKLAEGGWVAFAGDPGARFELAFL